MFSVCLLPFAPRSRQQVSYQGPLSSQITGASLPCSEADFCNAIDHPSPSSPPITAVRGAPGQAASQPEQSREELTMAAGEGTRGENSSQG